MDNGNSSTIKFGGYDLNAILSSDINNLVLFKTTSIETWLLNGD